MHGAALGALAVAAVVWPLEGLMEVVSLESGCGQVCLLELLEDLVVLAQLVAPELLQGHLSLDSPYHPALGTWPTWSRLDPCLATPAVQRSKSGRVTNAKAKIQI